MSYQPDGFTLSPGTWGTDAQMDFSTYLSGDASVVFENTTPASDPEYWEKVSPCSTGDAILGEWTVRADSIAAGNEVGCYIYWLDSTLAYISATAIFQNELPAADTWYSIAGTATAPANARYCGSAFTKKNTAFHVYLDMMGSRKFPVSAYAYLSGNQAAASGGSLDLVAFDAEKYDNGDCFNTGSGRWVAPVSGIYSISASLYASSLTSGDWMQAIIKVNGDSRTYGPKIIAGPGFDICAPVSEAGYYLDRGDYVEIFASHDLAAAENISGGTFYSSHMTIVRVQ